MGRSSGHRVPWPTAVTVIADMGTDRPQPGHSLPPHATESIVYLCGDKRVVGSGSLVWYSTLNNRAERHEIHPIFPLDGDGTSRAGFTPHARETPAVHPCRARQIGQARADHVSRALRGERRDLPSRQWRPRPPARLCGPDTDAAVNWRRRRSRALRRIERNLARSDPDLDRLFLSFASRAGRRWTPRVERIAPWPLRVLARLRHGARKPTPDSSPHHL